MSANEIFALRKQGRAADALRMARDEYRENAEDIWFLRAYAWVLYDHAKDLVDSYETNQLSPSALSSKISPYMREFAEIADALRGDSAFSQMIRLAGKVSKGWHEFLDFARWAGISDFSGDDCAAFVNVKGKTIDSLKSRFTRAICREAVARAADSQANQEVISWGLGVLEQALHDDPNDQWLNYYQSKLHLAKGEAELAIKRLAPVLRRQSSAAWPWALLGEILEPARPEDALNCYVHAVQMAREEQEVAKVRINLAQRLSLACRFKEAALQASLALKYREQHGYKVPQDLKILLATDWFQNAVASNNLQRLPKVDSAVNALLQELDRHILVYTKGVIDHINTARALSYVATSVNTGFGLSHRKFPQLSDLPPGTFVEVGHAGPEEVPLDWRLSQSNALPGLCETLSGNLERHEGKEFAFIRNAGDDIFVPPALAQAFAPGQKYAVSCLAIRRTNKQGKPSWRAVKVFEVDNPDGVGAAEPAT